MFYAAIKNYNTGLLPNQQMKRVRIIALTNFFPPDKSTSDGGQ